MRGCAESRAWAPMSRRALTAVVVLAVMAAMLTFTQRPAKAVGLLALGPVDPATLIPASYTDANGVSLQPCLAGPPLCFGTAADLLNPAAGEGFYQLVNADVPTAAGPGLAEFALEAALFAGPPEMSVFQRVRFRFNTPNPGTFTVTHPFGSSTFDVPAVVPGFEINDTVDIGCFGVVGNTCNDGVAPEFNAALGGPMSTFLRWDPAAAPAAPAGFTGDAATPHPVIGSPLAVPQNFVRIDGPNIGGPGVNTVETNLFTVSGLLAPGASPSTTTLAFGDAAAGAPAAPAQMVTLSNTTAAAVPITVALGGANAAAFALPGTGTCGASIPANGSCTIAVSFAPAAASLGALSATLTVTHAAAGSPATIALSGNGLPLVPALPAALPAPGTFSTAQDVTLTAAPGTTVHATVDGTPATATSPAVTGPLTADVGTTTIRAVAVDSLGHVSPEGTFTFVVSAPTAAPAPVSVTPTRNGYWLLASDGGVFAFGDAPFFGSLGGVRLSQPVVAMVATPSGNGYWMVTADGQVFSFGDAAFFGSMAGRRMAAPIVGMTSTPSGRGYWLLGKDGGIFSFGDAAFHGSTGAIRLNKPVLAMASTPSGQGYWLTASDGGIFAFGDAAFHGSTGAIRLNRPIVGMRPSPSGQGSWLTAYARGTFAFGYADFSYS